MPPPVIAPAGFNAPLSTDLNDGNSAKDLGLEQAVRDANGFAGENNSLDYILYCKGKGMALIPLSMVRQNVLARPERGAPKDGDESRRGQGAVASPPTPFE